MYGKSIQKTISLGHNNLKASIIIDKVIAFLILHLPNFNSHLHASAFTELLEKPINQKLALFLESQSRGYEFSTGTISPLYFLFIKDTDLNSSRRQPDIGVFLGSSGVTINEAFFHIECKRLPTPLKGGRLESEYARGGNNDGGIERFKKELHGASLSVGAMVAYIQKDDYLVWHKRVNGWIKNFMDANPDDNITWSKDDLLSNSSNNQSEKSSLKIYKSKNSRINYPPIILYHFWIPLS
jgi:hypothetical protein